MAYLVLPYTHLFTKVYQYDILLEDDNFGFDDN